MELVSTAWHAISAYFVVALGVVFSLFFAKKFSVKSSISLILYAWHTLLCLVYALYVINDGGDAIGYYNLSSNGVDFSFGVGGASVILLTSIFTRLLDFSLLGTFLVYNIIGYIGLLAFYGSLKLVTRDKSKNIQRLVLLIVFLPSISFWSSAIGKDAISFLAMGLSLWAALELNRRYRLMGIAILIMLCVRPHMAGMMIIGLSISLVVHGNISFLQRIILGAATCVATIIMIPFALDYAGVGGSDAEALMSYIDRRQGYNQRGGGGIDISSMSPPMQIFTYMFRPLPFEAAGVFQLAAAFENIILLFLFVFGGITMLRGRKSPLDENRIFMWVYILLAWILLAMTTANMGISARQKWMFAPMLIFLMISVMGKKSGSLSFKKNY